MKELAHRGYEGIGSDIKPDDKNYAPLNYYGQTKLEGELACFVKTL